MKAYGGREEDGLMNAIEAIESLRAVRKFLGREVEEEKIAKMIRAATMAPSSSNSQPWHFIVVKEREMKEKLGEVFLRTWLPIAQSRFARSSAGMRRIYDRSTEMVRMTVDVPLLIILCIDTKKASRAEEARYASIYPAAQNLMVAAWSMGIGSCFTTNGSMKVRGEDEVKEILNIPDYIKVAATIYLGYPKEKPSPPKRIPAEELTHRDSW